MGNIIRNNIGVPDNTWDFISSQTLSSNSIKGFTISAQSGIYTNFISANSTNLSVGGVSNISDLTIDIDKDWNSKGIYNLSYISTQAISTQSLTIMTAVSNTDTSIQLKETPTYGFSFIYSGASDNSFYLKRHYSSLDGNEVLHIERNNGTIYLKAPLSSQSSISSSSFRTGDFTINANIISGLAVPTFPSAASNKQYVDVRTPTQSEPSKVAGSIWMSGTSTYCRLYMCSSTNGGWHLINIT